jgi:Protein of unknown function (DUF4197)
LALGTVVLICSRNSRELHSLVDKESLTMETYVTGKAVDGSYLMIGEQEKAIRQDPISTGVKAISKVFGILK